MVSRNQTFDIAKGIAIASIVMGHVWRGLESAGLVSSTSSLFRSVDHTLYMFHLSVFAFTAGLFVQRGMLREGSWRYAAKRDLEFLWLYVLWSWLQVATKLLMGSTVNNQVSWWDVVSLWIPKEQFWFFGWIALMMLLAALFQPWISRLRLILSWAVIGTTSVLMWGVDGEFIGTQGLALTGFFWAGLTITGERLTRGLTRTPFVLQPILAVVLAGLMCLLVITTHAAPPTAGTPGTAQEVALGITASTAGVAAVVFGAAVLAHIRSIARPLAYLGRMSLVIFVAHVFFTAATRMVLVRLGIDSLMLHVGVGLTSGIAGPLLLHLVCERMRCGWLFALPQRLSVRKTPLSAGTG